MDLQKGKAHDIAISTHFTCAWQARATLIKKAQYDHDNSI